MHLPCNPSPCGPGSQCRVINNQATCSCLENVYGSDPYCQPECTINSDCSSQQICVNNKCKLACEDGCGLNADCFVRNHISVCTCREGYSGNPYERCVPKQSMFFVLYYDPKSQIPLFLVNDYQEPENPCIPSPCGPNSQCHAINNAASCSCLPEFQGTPPYCRPECVVDAECAPNKICSRSKCKDPCPGLCGVNALCIVTNHIPSCICSDYYTGNPYNFCQRVPPKIERPVVVHNIGRPVVVQNIERPVQKIERPAVVHNIERPVVVHNIERPVQKIERPVVVQADECDSCGVNAYCKGNSCVCRDGLYGNPKVICRPECVINSECSQDKACINNKCASPCNGVCGINAICEVRNHFATCSCPQDMIGNAFVKCVRPERDVPKDACQPNPCGLNSICRDLSGRAHCECVDNTRGSPPDCRYECSSNNDCSLQEICRAHKCIDPCQGLCGFNARCKVIHHSPLCYCEDDFNGNPYIACTLKGIRNHIQINFFSKTFILLLDKKPEINPCQPSPCGPYSTCRVNEGTAVCSCLESYSGTPPYCKPECVSDSECSSNEICKNFKCVNPCSNDICGRRASCRVLNHITNCYCDDGYTGNPFFDCERIRVIENDEPVARSCVCGVNAECVDRSTGTCKCIPNYFGNPYEICRPECVINSDCPSHLSCQQNKCQNPCNNLCGSNANCVVSNHYPLCLCNPGYTGNPYDYCNVQPQRDRKH